MTATTPTGGRGLFAIAIAVAVLVAAGAASASDASGSVNPEIDMPGFLRHAHDAAEARRTRLLSERAFLRLRAEPGTVVLDARSRERFDELHVEGALHLAFTDMTAESLAALIPDPATRILVYCNNNFRGAPGAFPSKLPAASLNLSTVVALRTYGYREVYELGPLLDAGATLLPLVPTRGHR